MFLGELEEVLEVSNSTCRVPACMVPLFSTDCSMYEQFTLSGLHAHALTDTRDTTFAFTHSYYVLMLLRSIALPLTNLSLPDPATIV
ncbi:hypothetical protein Scep_018071 [Stephania cephalantha]|uniref:Uncharacterized protein n=1 Tax=Stephania cephalantha TaxID=152367 RepID=A0AAP0NUW2_9MAGN